MAESGTKNGAEPVLRIRRRGRRSQILIYLGKFLRMFVYQNDWKVVPMAAVIAGLVAIVIRSMYFRTMEGTLMGAFALACVAIWNGCFNSIQVICRERDVIKREHRSGMHISSYVAAHLIYQALLCLLQTAITLYVCSLVGVRFPAEGKFTPWMITDIGITLFLISFASDAMSLFVSSLAHTTTAAMTIMPFVLIFQLVFSGGMLSLPEWSRPLSDLTISRYGMTALAAQADYNERPLVQVWSSLMRMKDTEVGGTVTVGQVLDFLGRDEIPAVHELRETRIEQTATLRELAQLAEDSGAESGTVLNEWMMAMYGDTPIHISFTIGNAVDFLSGSPGMESDRERPIRASMTVGEIIEMIGENKAHLAVQEKATAASYNEEYESSGINILYCWTALIFITLVFAALTTITLEFIDRDKR